VDPGKLVKQALKVRGSRLMAAGRVHPLRGRLVLIAAGKAACTMARAAEDVLGPKLDAALVVDTSASTPLVRARLLLAGHPLPDARGLRAAREVERLCASLGAQDTLLVLLSGGASALLPAPVPGLTLRDKAAVTRLLMAAGANIVELNVVRKHLSRLKGGGLVRAAAPARVITLVLSDVVGDDLAVIASGPTVPDPTTYADAWEVLRRRRLLRRVPASVRRHLAAGRRGARPETPKPGDPLFRRVQTAVLGSGRTSVAAAETEALRRGFRTRVLTTRLTGEARAVSPALVAELSRARGAAAGRRGVCLLAAGETTVTVQGTGRGGRNQEVAVAAMPGLSAMPGPALLASLATDGIDGKSDAAGGVADQTSLGRVRELGLAPPAYFLSHNDSEGLLAALGDLLITGPTGTNVADVVVLLAH
jgi:glycerate-2-kinase